MEADCPIRQEGSVMASSCQSNALRHEADMLAMTQETVKQLWFAEAAEVVKKAGITGGTKDEGWDQNVNALITWNTMRAIDELDLDETEAKQAKLHALYVGSNSSQNGQSLFSEKKTKATAIANKLINLAK